MHPVVFSAAWFDRHQRVLLALLRAPLLGRVCRRLLAIRPHDVGWHRPIVQLLPHAYIVDNGDGTRTMDARTHDKYGKRLYHQLRPLWWLLHAWDAAVANPWAPALNAGFDTLTQYPEPAGASVAGNGTSTNPTPGAVTCSEPGDFVVAINANGATTWAPSAQAGTIIANTDDGADGGGEQYAIRATPGAFTLNWTFGTSDDWGAVVAAFYEPQAVAFQNYMGVDCVSDGVMSVTEKIR